MLGAQVSQSLQVSPQSSMPGGIYKKIEPDRVLTEVAPTGIEPVFHA